MHQDVERCAFRDCNSLEFDSLQCFAGGPCGGGVGADHFVNGPSDHLPVIAQPGPLIGVLCKKMRRKGQLGAGGVDTAENRDDDEIDQGLPVDGAARMAQ